jgi:tyrosyl-tRNA synthetase
MKTIEEQIALLEQGCEKVYSIDELRTKLTSGRQLRIKLGADPTAPDLHLGHSVVLRKMRQFQDLGHKAIFIIGDYTALVGDPTGQNRTRPMLSLEQIKKNAETYFQQAGKILDMSPEKLEIRFNSEWLAKMNLADVIRLASQMSVARMMERDTFEKRHKAGEPISVHEFLYPLMQGHDSVCIRADVELGGTDQTFNNLVGRDLQRNAGQEPQVVMVLPILEGLDGEEKMSKSKGNYIGISESPKDMFGKTMSISDELMAKWYRMLLGRELTGHPMEAKKRLAREIVAQYHGAESGALAQQEFEKQFSKRDLSEAAGTLEVPGEVWIVELVEKTGAFKSRSDIRRLIQQGGVSLDGQKYTDAQAKLQVHTGQILKAGKLTVVRLLVR